MAADIFDQRLFGNLTILDDLKSDGLYNGIGEEGPHIVLRVTIFDYILAQKFDMLPYNGTYYDWLTYRYCSVQSLRELNTKLGGSIADLVDTILVHQDLFNDAEIDLTHIYPAMAVTPQDYRICCMQWDAYNILYRVEYAHDGSNISWLCGPCITHDMDKDPLHDNRTVADNERFHVNEYDIVCNQLIDPVIQKISTPPNKDKYEKRDFTMYIYNSMTSSCGELDVYFSEAIGEYMEYKNALTSFTAMKEFPSSACHTRVSKSFFSDVYGCP